MAVWAFSASGPGLPERLPLYGQAAQGWEPVCAPPPCPQLRGWKPPLLTCGCAATGARLAPGTCL